MTRLILLDRDGVINQDSDAFVKSVSEFLPITGAIDAIADLCRAGFRIAVCTNQSGVGRGLLTETTLADIHAELHRQVEAAGGHIHALHYCPHLPDAGCDCRKPKPGLLTDALASLDESPAHAVFVGDSLRDVEAARAAGVRAVLVRTGKGVEAEAAVRALGVEEIYEDLRAFAEAEISRRREAGR